MPRHLPANPSVEFLQKEAKHILKAHKNGDESTCGIYRQMRRFSDLTDQEILQRAISLQETQLALALNYGFEGWKELKAHVKKREDFSPSILTIDDDDNQQELVAKMFRQKGYHVTTALHGEAGIKALESDRYDLVLTDLNHPGVGGMDILKYVVQRSPATKCIILTGHADFASSVEALRLGAFDCIAKPITAEELIAAVEKALQTTQLEEKNTGSAQHRTVSEPGNQQKGGSVAERNREDLFCSFCGKSQREATKLIAGPAVYICDECVQLCSRAIAEEDQAADNPPDATDASNASGLGKVKSESQGTSIKMD